MYQYIITEKSEGVGTIILNRPDRLNALNLQILRELKAAIEDVEKDQTVRVVVITGNGRAFCAGADLELMSQFRAVGKTREFVSVVQEVFNTIEDLAKPVIAAVNGFALAGGLELMLCCDLILAADNAVIGDEHVNRSLMPGGGSTARLPRVVGVRMAKELLFTGRRISAKEAMEIGLVNNVVPSEQLRKAVHDLALEIAGKSPLMLQLVKLSVNRGLDSDLKSALQFEALAFNTAIMSEEAGKGLDEFLRKRKP